MSPGEPDLSKPGEPGLSAHPPLAVPVKTAAAKLDPAPSTPVYEKRLIGKGIWYRHEIEGKPLWQCWKEVRPAAKAAMTEMASRYLKWYRARFPLQISKAFETLISSVDISQESSEVS